MEILGFAYRVAIVFCAVMLGLIAIHELLGGNLQALNLLGGWVWALPAAVLLSATVGVQHNWLTRTKSFGTLSASLVVGNTVTSGSRIAAGIAAGSTVVGLIVGQLLGMVANLAVQWRAGRVSLRSVASHMSWDQIRRIAVEYKDFPLLNAPAGLIFALGQNLPVLLFGSMFSPAIAGLYAMAHRLSKVPINIGATAVRRVFLQKAATVNNSGRPLSRAFLVTLSGLAALGVGPAAIIWFYGEPIVAWLLGGNWSNAGRFMEIVAPWMFMLWITSPCNAIFVVLRRQSLWLALQSTLTILRLGAFGVAYTIGAGVEWTLAAFVVATVIGNLVTILVTTRLTLTSKVSTDAADAKK